MQDYYNNLLINKLKKDVTKDILNNDSINCNVDIIKNIIEEYFKNNKIEFKDDKETLGIKDSKTHKYRPRSNVIDYSKCMARVWNEGMGGQCSRKKNKEYGDFCKRHHTLGGYNWNFGTVDKPKERQILHNGKVHIWLTN